MYNLTPRQKTIVCSLVDAYKNGHADELVWFNADQGAVFKLPDPAAAIPASGPDVKAILDEKMLVVSSRHGDLCSVMGLTQKAFDAVRTNFGVNRRDAVLRAVYELSGGKIGILCDASKIATAAGLSVEDVTTYGMVLNGERLLTGVRGGDNPQFALTYSGLAAAEAPMPAHPQPTGMIQHNYNAPVGAVQTGPHAVAHVDQRGHSPAELLAAVQDVRAQASDLEGNVGQIASILDDLIATMEAGNKPDPSLLDRLGKAAKTGQNLAEFASAAAKVWKVFHGTGTDPHQ